MQAVADREKAPGMAAYMKNHFVFMGCDAKSRRAAAKPVMAEGKGRDPDELLDFADECWRQKEREFQYVGMDLVRKYAKLFEPEHLPRIEGLIRTKSWWDTVDSLAAWTVGPMVANHQELTTIMDRWIDDEDVWIARTAILHQLSYKDRCNAERLFSYADKRAADTEFFIRKALGWALRQHARTDPEAVRDFVDDRAESLSGLTRGEALKHL